MIRGLAHVVRFGIGERRVGTRRRVGDQHPAAFDVDPTLGDELDSEWIEAVFLPLDPIVQALFGVVCKDRNGCLQQNGSMVSLLVDEVNGYAGDACAMLQGLPLGV